MKPSRIAISAAFCLLAAGCDAPLPPGSTIDSFRVMAQQVDQPYARPGETVQLRSLSFDPEARPISWVWASCVNPASNDVDGCINRINQQPDPAAAVFAMGASADAPTLTIPSDAISSLPQSARGAATVGVVSAACPGDLSLGDGPGGLPFRCLEAGTGRELSLHELIVGIKRIGVRQSDRNQNPVIAGVRFDGEDWPTDEVKSVDWCDRSDFDYGSCPKAAKHQLAALVTPDSFERGQDELGRSFEEQVVIQHFATEGIFESEFRIGAEPENGWVARKSAAGRTLTLWFVAHDDRGGESWTSRQVRVND